MPCLIKLESVDDNPVEIIQIDQGSILIGREPENHVVVDSESVSRRHAALHEAEGVWVFQDFESTNGSWLNGVRLSAGVFKPLRNDDVIQLADFPMRYRVQSPAAQESFDAAPSVLVFDEGGQFRSISFLQGDPFSIGGAGSTLELGGDTPLLRIGRSAAGGVELVIEADAAQNGGVLLNGTQVHGVNRLNDRDEIRFAGFVILLCDVASSKQDLSASTMMQQSTAPQAGPSVHAQAHANPQNDAFRGWDTDSERQGGAGSKKFVFGTSPDENEVTSTMNMGSAGFNFDGSQSQGGGFEMSMSQRFSQAVYDAENEPQSKLKETMMAIFGVLVFCLIVGFMAYFAMQFM
jgi:pSer/pThr/pTyr-binding forkhead associated (FHA) protein